jgi:UDP-GlcNAc3NAcA epimerase
MIKIVTVIGARPQFIKAAAISRAIRSKYSDKITEILVHTGQHYDPNMSSVFFEELDIPAPDYNLEISGGTHGAMTGKMLESIENVLLAEKPDWVLIYGDTNSTLAAALAAAKLHIPIAHVEAGLRSFNMNMPEEVNRIVADRLSRITFCPTRTAVENLHNEGIKSGVHLVGDVMYDVSLYFRDIARQKSNALERLGLEEGQYVLATCHRAENTDSSHRLTSIVQGLADLALQIPVVLPLHPRTRKKIEDLNLTIDLSNITVVEPLPFLDMIRLEQAARVIVTDSGGVQKEAFFYEVPCVTMRDETEWTETVELGLNVLVGADRELIANSLSRKRPEGKLTQPYGNGSASDAILDEMLSAL